MQKDATPRVELTFDSFGDFVADSASWLSKSLAFISTEEMLPIGSPVEIDVSCTDGRSLVRGLGRVSWIRKQAMRADQPAGLGIGFVSLEAGSEALIDALERLRTSTGLEATPEIGADMDPAAGAEATDTEADRDATSREHDEPAFSIDDQALAAATGVAGIGAATEFSFSDVEAAVSREIDAVVLHEKIRQERVAREQALAESASEDAADHASDTPDSEEIAVGEETTATEEIAATEEMAATEEVTATEAVTAEEEAVHEEVIADTPATDEAATTELATEEPATEEPVSDAVVSASFDEIDDDEFLAPLDLALTEVESPASSPNEEGSVEQATVEQATVEQAPEPDDADTAAVALEAEESIEDTAPIVVETEDPDTAAVELEAEDADTAAIEPVAEDVETAAVDVESFELESAEIDLVDIDETTTAQVAIDIEDVAAAAGATTETEPDDASDEAPEEEEAPEEVAAPGTPVPRQPAGGDPWDLDVASFLDDALKEQAAAERASSGPFPRPVRPVAPVAADATDSNRAEERRLAEASERKPSDDDEDTLDYGVPRSAVNKMAEDQGASPPINPSVSAPEPSAVARSESEHPEARAPSLPDDETLEGIPAVPAKIAAAGGREPEAADMAAEPDFDTMAARIEVPPIDAPPIDVPSIDPPPRPLVTTPIETIPDESPPVSTTASRPTASRPMETPSSIDLEASVAAASASPPPADDATPKPGYYAQAGRRKKTKRGLTILAAILAFAAIGAGLFFSGILDGPLARLRPAATDAVADRGSTPPTVDESPAGTAGDEKPTSRPAATVPVPSDTTPADTAATDTAASDTAVSDTEATDTVPAGATVAENDADATDTVADSAPADAVPVTVEDAPPADQATAAASVEQALDGWAAAWSDQDPERYLSFYDASFETPDNLSRTAWTDQRRQRLRAPQSIRVRVSDIEIESWNGDRARVRAYQSYRTETRSLGTWKRFDLVWRDGGWRIARERLVQ